MTPTNKPSRIWRRVERGSLTVNVPGVGVINAVTGTWLESVVFRHVFGGARAQLGATMPDAHLQRKIGYLPPMGQIVVDPDAAAPAPRRRCV